MAAAGAGLCSPGSFAASDLATAGPLRPASRLTFTEIEHGVSETHVVAPGYRCEVLIRWGEPVLPGAPVFDPRAQSAASQEAQFGYNNDHIAYLPLPRATASSHRGLLCVNHEYAQPELMFPEQGADRARAEIEQAAMGCSVVEVAGEGGAWRVVTESPFARRVSTRSTECVVAGPAAGNERLRTAADPDGRRVLGTLSNCGGGVTPWGTCLIAEENINIYFRGRRLDSAHREARNHARYGIGKRPLADWHRFFERWDVGSEPNEPNRFGWVVELDPYEPSSTPVKRTALGRFFHEGAEVVLNADGRLVVYMGDDNELEYLYRYVSNGRFRPGEGVDNGALFDDGVLSTARFHADGSLTWVPLVHGEGPLTAGNGFRDQADVLIEARVAADLAGATAMDRPEGIAVSPSTGRVYVSMTHNRHRRADRIDAVNRRAENLWGHIVELVPPGGDHTAQVFGWEILVQCGPPREPRAGATWNPGTSAHGWFARPDNCVFDHHGRFWVCTDQGGGWHEVSGTADGLWAVETEGARRATGKMFFRVPVGAELTGPAFTPDDQALFLSVQHPGADGTRHYPPFGRASTFSDPATRWPDFDADLPPRPAVVVVTRNGGGLIGS